MHRIKSSTQFSRNILRSVYEFINLTNNYNFGVRTERNDESRSIKSCRIPVEPIRKSKDRSRHPSSWSISEKLPRNMCPREWHIRNDFPIHISANQFEMDPAKPPLGLGADGSISSLVSSINSFSRSTRLTSSIQFELRATFFDGYNVTLYFKLNFCCYSPPKVPEGDRKRRRGGMRKDRALKNRQQLKL